MSLDHVAALLRPDAPVPFAAGGAFHNDGDGCARGVHAEAWHPLDKACPAVCVIPASGVNPIHDCGHNLTVRIDRMRRHVEALLFVVFRLDQIINDPVMLYQSVANDHFFMLRCRRSRPSPT